MGSYEYTIHQVPCAIYHRLQYKKYCSIFFNTNFSVFTLYSILDYLVLFSLMVWSHQEFRWLDANFHLPEWFLEQCTPTKAIMITLELWWSSLGVSSWITTSLYKQLLLVRIVTNIMMINNCQKLWKLLLRKKSYIYTLPLRKASFDWQII